MAEYIISSGESSEGIILENDTMIVLDGGIANGTTVDYDGYLCVSSGGTANYTTVNDYGGLHVSSGGTANNTTVNTNSWLGVDEGGTVNSTAVNSGGWLEVEGGTVNSIAVNSGGSLWVGYGTVIGILENGGYVGAENNAEVSFVKNAFSGLVLSDTSATVHSGTTANSTTVYDGGYLEVYSGGLANNTIVSDNGYLEVHSDGTANSTTVNYGGHLDVHNGGTATITFTPWAGEITSEGPGASIIYLDRDAKVYYGGENGGVTSKADTFDFLVVEKEKTAIVYSGGTVNNTTINDGQLIVSSGGTADSTTLIDGGEINVSSGGTANSTTLINGGGFYVSSGGTANCTTINFGGEFYVSSDGTANNTTVNSGSLCVFSGGIANDVMVRGGYSWSESGVVKVSSGGTANNVTVNGCGYLYVESGGTATVVFNPWQGSISSSTWAIVKYLERDANVYFGANTGLVSRADTIDSLLVDSGNSVIVYSDGQANSTTLIGSNGRMYVSSGGIVNNTSVCGDWDGIIYVSSGGTANNTLLDSGGGLEVFSGGMANSVTVNYCYFDVSSGGMANNVIVNNVGRLTVFSGGSATNIKENGGVVDIEENTYVMFSPNTFSGLTLSDAAATVHSGTIANGITVKEGGELIIYSGGSAVDIVWTPCVGQITLSGDANISFVSQYSGVYFGSENQLISHAQVMNEIVLDGGNMYAMADGTANNTSISNHGKLYVHSGGIANGALVAEYGSMFVSNGAANDTIVSGGRGSDWYVGYYDKRGILAVSQGGIAERTVVNNYGTLNVQNDGIANSTTVNTGGRLYVSAKGLANSTTVNSNGNLYVSVGGIANNTLLNSNSFLIVTSDGVANETTINGSGYLHVSSCGLVNKTVINTNGYLYVSSGGTADNTLMSAGSVFVLSGGIGNSVFMSGGMIHVSSGGKLTGRVTCLNGTVSAFDGAIVNFDLTGLIPGTAARINNLSRIQGAPRYTITVNANQTEGVYDLADGAGAFNQSITVVDTVGTELGTLSVSESITISGVAYTLNLSSNSLSLKIGDKDTPPLYTSNGLIVYNETVAVKSGETFFDTLVMPSAELAVSSGGTAIQTTIYDKGRMTVLSGGSATGIKASVSSYLGLAVSLDTCIEGTSGGSAIEIKDGKVSNYEINSGYLQIFSGGTANNVTVQTGTWMALNEGQANSTVVSSGGNLYVSSGGIANGTEVNTNGQLAVSSGGVVNNINVNSGGQMNIYLGGSADNVTVNANAYLYVSSGGTATRVIWTPCEGKVIAKEGAYVSFVSQYSGVYYGSDNILLSSAVVMNSVTLESTCEMYVMSNGTADSTTINNAGVLYIVSGGVVTNATVNNGGSALISGGNANRTNITKGGKLFIFSGGTANETMVNEGGYLYIEIGGTATGITASAGAYLGLDVTSGTDVAGTSGGAAFEIKDGKMSDYTVNNGYLRISKGGSADNVVINGGNIFVASDGIVNNVSVNSNGMLTISSGGTAMGIVENGGFVSVNENASVSFASTTLLGQTLLNSATIHSGTTMIRTTVSRGGLFIYSGGIADNSVLLEGRTTVYSGGYANSTTVYSNARFEVSSGGMANGLVVKSRGSAIISEGGLLRDLTISYGGYVYLHKGKISGKVMIESGASVSADNGTTMDFDISKITPDSVAFVNNLSLIRGTPQYTLTVGTQKSGSYALAEGALRFNSTITVFNTDGIQLGTLTVGDTLKTEKATYSLVSFGESLSVDVETFAPKAPTATADITGSTMQPVTVTAVFGEDCTVREYSYDCKEWLAYTAPIEFTENGTVYFRGADAVGNLSEVTTITVDNIVSAPLEVPVVSADVTTATSGTVTVTASFNERATTKQYSLDGKTWLDYTAPLTFKENGTAIFLCQDATGTFTCASYTVNNIDTTAPTTPTGLQTVVSEQTVAMVWNASADDDSGVKDYLVTYSLNGQEFTVRTTNTSCVLNNADFGSYSWSVQAFDFAGNESAIVAGDAFEVSGFKPYTVEYSADNFEHVIRFTVSSPTLDSFRMPTGTYQLRVRQEGNTDWTDGDPIVATEFDSTPRLVKSDADGNADVFFANPVGTWESGYVAQHVGSINDWTGTNEYAAVFGKNKLADIIEGSTDANILLMTDDDNGDTLFVDDIYTASPGNIAEKQSRIAQVDEIRAGAGNDIVDMTSQQFEYVGNGIAIRGGEGNDTIWANKGNNWLFGDAGNDRIVGASGNDVIAGGIGNDRMHGGGGNDVFTFCDNWGVDNVEQLATGSVTLWFAEGSNDNWDEATLTYTDGENNVKVSGVTADKVTLKFGDDGSAQYASLTSMGAFFDATSERIFEESGKGILASL